MFDGQAEFLEHPRRNGQTVDVGLPDALEDAALQDDLGIRPVDDLGPFL